jgi:Trypsin
MKLLPTVCTAAILAATYNTSVSALEGQLAEKQFPFVLQFYAWYEKPEKKGSACTATVIEPRLLVTAAHCVTKPYVGKTPESFVSNISSSVWVNLQEGNLPKDNPTRQKLINAGILMQAAIAEGLYSSKTRTTN